METPGDEPPAFASPPPVAGWCVSTVITQASFEHVQAEPAPEPRHVAMRRRVGEECIRLHLHLMRSMKPAHRPLPYPDLQDRLIGVYEGSMRALLRHARGTVYQVDSRYKELCDVRLAYRHRVQVVDDWGVEFRSSEYGGEGVYVLAPDRNAVEWYLGHRRRLSREIVEHWVEAARAHAVQRREDMGNELPLERLWTPEEKASCRHFGYGETRSG